jgi:hypothetical protein
VNEKNRTHLLRSCAATTLLNELGLENTRARSSAAAAVGLCINLGFYGELFVMTIYLQLASLSWTRSPARTIYRRRHR